MEYLEDKADRARTSRPSIMDKLMALQQHYEAAENDGPKTPVEDAMVGILPHCTFNLNPRALVD